jgi:predicted secreted protein
MRIVGMVARSLLATLVVVTALSGAAIATGVTAFGLSLTGALALYFLVWWITLFAVLPFGVSSQAEAGDVAAGSDPGAPALPALGEKAVWTSLAASLVFTLIAWLLPLAGL